MVLTSFTLVWGAGDLIFEERPAFDRVGALVLLISISAVISLVGAALGVVGALSA